MTPRPVHLFNPSDRRFGPHNADLDRLQEIIFYSESRTRTILADIIKSPVEEAHWKKVRLSHELVCTAL